ncbi:MAG: pyridoxal phosphate-dependent aminotransferase [Acidobacteria bacterium]|nr:pyridoxal phosphate-dependent aminotransferase [Acidobacteriota bacterium]
MPPAFVRSRIQGIELPPFDPLNTRAAELRAAGHPVISLGQAVPFFPPPAPALEAAREALTRPEVHRYATDPGLPGLRALLAERLASTIGTRVTRDDVVITAGGNHAFTLALTTLVDAGDEVILPAPYFTNHQMAVVAAGATAIEAPAADRATFAVRWTDIEPHVTSRTKAVVLCNPSNPTGAPVEPGDGARIAGELARRGVLVISDETYMQFVYDGAHWSAASVADWRQNVVVIGTFSKSFGMMGWRVGFLLADAAVCEQAVKVQDAMIICAPTISQMAAEAAVRDCWSYPLSFHDELRRRRAVLAEGLAAIPRMHWTPTRGGLFAFARVDGCADSAALSRDLLERAYVVTIPGASFGASGEGFLRLSYGYADAPELEDATGRLRRFFAGA